MLSSDTTSNTNTICCLHPGHRTMELATIGFIVACFITSASSQCPTGSDKVTQPDGSPLTCSSNTPCPNPYFCASGVCCINCPANQEWNNCGSACIRTCEAPNPICILSCAPGCHCPANAPIWHNDQCISQDECDIKKCPSDSPVVNITTGNELNCGIGGETCPERTFCNADPFGRFDVCCPVCNQRVDTGKCRGYLPRWYFNSVTNRCQNFIYGGCGGNANRFVTEHECQRQCPPLPGKCPSGHPLLGPTGAELTCRTQPCPKGSFCMAHPAEAYTVCCPSKCPSGHPLLGPTGAELTCRTQPCPKGSFCKTHPADAYTVCCPNVPMKCPNGAPLVDSTGMDLFCGRELGSQRCPPGTYCNIAPYDSFTVCCPGATASSNIVLHSDLTTCVLLFFWYFTA